MSIDKKTLISFIRTYFGDEDIQNRVIARINEDITRATDSVLINHSLDAMVYGLEQLLIDRENLEFTDLKWGRFISNHLDSILILLKMD